MQMNFLGSLPAPQGPHPPCRAPSPILLRYRYAGRAKATITGAFARERSEWEKVADRPDEGTFFQMFDYLFLPVVGPVVVLGC